MAPPASSPAVTPHTRSWWGISAAGSSVSFSLRRPRRTSDSKPPASSILLPKSTRSSSGRSNPASAPSYARLQPSGCRSTIFFNPRGLCGFTNVSFAGLTEPFVQQLLQPEEDLVSPLDLLPLGRIQDRHVALFFHLSYSTAYYHHFAGSFLPPTLATTRRTKHPTQSRPIGETVSPDALRVPVPYTSMTLR